MPCRGCWHRTRPRLQPWGAVGQRHNAAAGPRGCGRRGVWRCCSQRAGSGGCTWGDGKDPSATNPHIYSFPRGGTSSKASSDILPSHTGARGVKPSLSPAAAGGYRCCRRLPVTGCCAPRPCDRAMLDIKAAARSRPPWLGARWRGASITPRLPAALPAQPEGRRSERGRRCALCTARFHRSSCAFIVSSRPAPALSSCSGWPLL